MDSKAKKYNKANSQKLTHTKMQVMMVQCMVLFTNPLSEAVFTCKLGTRRVLTRICLLLHAANKKRSASEARHCRKRFIWFGHVCCLGSSYRRHHTHSLTIICPILTRVKSRHGLCALVKYCLTSDLMSPAFCILPCSYIW